MVCVCMSFPQAYRLGRMLFADRTALLNMTPDGVLNSAIAPWYYAPSTSVFMRMIRQEKVNSDSTLPAAPMLSKRRTNKASG